jgi:hypothetical protein
MKRNGPSIQVNGKTYTLAIWNGEIGQVRAANGRVVSDAKREAVITAYAERTEELRAALTELCDQADANHQMVVLVERLRAILAA